jgi:branched-chain amino acid transport system substrate-binding protein
VFEDAGGIIVKKLWPPLNTADFTPFLAQIADVDGVWNGFAGSNPIKFNQQYAELGLKAKYPIVGGWTAYDDALLKSFGDEALGAISASWYSSDLDTPSNKRFVADMVKDNGNIPGGYAAGMYIAGMCIEGALQKTGGKTDSKDALIAALRAVSLTDTPRGAFHFDHLGNVIGNVFIRKIERKDGKLVNTTVKIYRDVGQFWTYDEKAYLAKPVYSRDYPPLKS